MKKMRILLLITILTLSIIGLWLFSGIKPVLKIYDAKGYITEELITSFENEYQVNIIHHTNEKQTNNPIDKAKYDIIITDDYILEDLIANDYLQQLDWSLLSNANNLNAQIIDHNKYDLNNVYSVPYFWGTLGIIYNQKKVDVFDLNGWEILKNPKYKEQIYLYDNSKEAFAIALNALGYSVNTEDSYQIQQAYSWLVEQKDLVNPSYIKDEIIELMISGEKDIATIYSDDAAYVMSKNEDMQYYEPEEGTNIWIDAIVITNDCNDVGLAHKWIDYMLDKHIALKNFNSDGYKLAIENNPGNLVEVFQRNNNQIDIAKNKLPELEVLSPNNIIYNATTNELVYATNHNSKIYPASLTKLLTALVAIDYLTFEEIITIGNEIKAIGEGSSIANLRVGDKISFEGLLNALLLPSGNDAAYAIAIATTRKIDPNINNKQAVDLFAQLMNQKAYDLGAINSNFVVPDGYHNDNHYSSLFDLVLITAEFLNHPSLREIVSHYKSKPFTIENRTVVFVNTNLLLEPNSAYYFPQTLGVKTGYTLISGRSMIAAITIDKQLFVTINTGTETRQEAAKDAISLLNYVKIKDFIHNYNN